MVFFACVKEFALSRHETLFIVYLM